MTWLDKVYGDPIKWLLEKDEQNPGIRYFSLLHFMDKSENHPEVIEARQAITHHGPVPAILAAQHPEGYWEKSGPGYSPKYRGTAWQIITVDEDGDVGQYSSLTLDSAGFPHIGYYDASHMDLKYAYFYSDQLQVPVDVKPRECPNQLNVRVRGRLPVAVVGTEDFDVAQVDPASVLMYTTPSVAS